MFTLWSDESVRANCCYTYIDVAIINYDRVLDCLDIVLPQNIFSISFTTTIACLNVIWSLTNASESIWAVLS